MNANRKVSSIARRMNRSWSWRLLGVFFWIDLVAVLLAVTGYCYSAEVARLGGFAPGTSRGFSCDPSGGPLEWARTLAYGFADADGVWTNVPLGDFLGLLLLFIRPLLIFEGVLFLGQRLFGARRARRILRPIQKLADTAQLLSDEQRYASTRPTGESQLHDLEDAIASIAPNRPDVRLSTGNSELTGLENAINELLRRTHESYRLQARFVSDASHELRTPIAVIQGYASMLARWGKDDKQVLDEAVDAIQSETARMSKLVEQLLFLARGDSGRQKADFTTVDLAEMTREACEESKMIDAKHEWSARCEGVVNCVGDRDMLRQALRVFTDNAAKYTPEEGSIRLSAYVKDGAPCFEVQDSGAGIASEDLPHVFERFYRADPARGGREGGTGLGLAIAKWIVERHGGYVELLSRPGLGTRATVVLPTYRDPAEAPSAKDGRAAGEKR